MFHTKVACHSIVFHVFDFINTLVAVQDAVFVTLVMITLFFVSILNHFDSVTVFQELGTNGLTLLVDVVNVATVLSLDIRPLDAIVAIASG